MKPSSSKTSGVTGLLKLAICLLCFQTGVVVTRGNDTAHIVATRQKLADIILPDVEFRQTTLSAALEFLRQESRRLDPEPDPEARGVNLALQANAPSLAQARITLTLRHVPLGEVLRYVAAQAGLRLQVDFYAVSLVSAANGDDQLITAVMRVPPTFFGNRTSDSSQANSLNQAGAPTH